MPLRYCTTRAHIASRSEQQSHQAHRITTLPLSQPRKRKHIIIESDDDNALVNSDDSQIAEPDTNPNTTFPTTHLSDTDDSVDSDDTDADQSDTPNDNTDDDNTLIDLTTPHTQQTTQNITRYFSIQRPRIPPTPTSLPSHLTLKSSIPCFSVATYNITSLSAYAKDPVSESRRCKVIEDITHLTTHSHVIFIQETHLNLHGYYHALHTTFPTWQIEYNNPTDHKGGTLIMLSPTILYHYIATPEPILPSLRGHAQTILLTGKPNKGTTPLPVRLLNVYLATGDQHHIRRSAQLKSLLNIPNDTHLIMGGDFNFVERRHDATEYTDYHKLKKGADKHWRKLIHKHGLWEVSQDRHTQVALRLEGPRTSRIDRFYITHNEADTALYTPHTTILNTPNSILNNFTNPQHSTKTHISTHIALTLSFHSTDTHDKHLPYKLPPWVPRTSAYKQIFLDLWKELPPNSDPFETEVFLKRTAKLAHKLFKKQKHNQTETEADSLCDLHSSILRLKAITTPNDQSTSNNSPPEISSLRSRISKLLENGNPGPGITTYNRQDSDRSEGAAIFRAKATPAQVTDKITTILPSTKTPLTTLRARITDTPTTDPKAQANIIKTFWGGIWALFLLP